MTVESYRFVRTVYKSIVFFVVQNKLRGGEPMDEREKTD